MNDAARVIDITEEAPTVALSLPEKARAIRVVDYVSREAANAYFLDCRAARKVIDAFYDPKIEDWKAAKKKADEGRAKMVAEKDAALAPILEGEKIANAEITRFDAEDRKRREEEQRIAEAKACKEAEERALAEAAAAEAAGEREEAEEIIKEAVHAPVFVPVPPPPPKLAGSAEVTIWKIEVSDLKALVLAVASGKAPLTYLQANTVTIGATVRAQKTSFSCPGVKAWPEVSRKSTGR